ncbi:RICIN domain-containing protein [Streptomyces sp. NPDC001922]|uniref:RICIN domain-containing protein n=1 Tax=Streptomyces sp. NPDC001922 TaxID=3364624 RepID=UPI003677271C
MSDPLAAPDDSPLSQAFRELSETMRTTLANALRDHADSEAPLLEPGTDADSPLALALDGLYEAYLRAYATRSRSRTCRHLTAVLGDTVRNGSSTRSQDFDEHADTCDNCSRARTDIVAIRTGEYAFLSAVLTAGTADGPSRRPAERKAAAPKMSSQPVAQANRAWPVGWFGSWDGGRRFLPATPAGLAAVVAVAVVVTTVVAVGVTVHILTDDTPAPPEPLARETFPVPGTTVAAPTATRTVSVSPSPAPSRTTDKPRERRSGKPAAEAVASASSASPTAPAGFQLVNRATGLCVGIVGAAKDEGAMMQLQTCDTYEAAQRWSRAAASQGNTYALRNTGSGKCLDGTSGGGNVVRVVQQECAPDEGRPSQLWTFQPEPDSSGYRLLFVPQVSDTDYASHLFGPEDWHESKPPGKGTYLAHQPNYYNSASFVFTMRDGA